MEVESGGQEKAVGHQRVGGIERRIVEHLEIDRSMRRAGCMVDLRIDVNRWCASPSSAIARREGNSALTGAEA
jgi:hypothetical protein